MRTDTCPTVMAPFVKDRAGKMGLLTIPRGTVLHCRDGSTAVAKRKLRKLAMPSTSPQQEMAYSIKMDGKYWWVLRSDIDRLSGIK